MSGSPDANNQGDENKCALMLHALAGKTLRHDFCRHKIDSAFCDILACMAYSALPNFDALIAFLSQDFVCTAVACKLQTLFAVILEHCTTWICVDFSFRHVIQTCDWVSSVARQCVHATCCVALQPKVQGLRNLIQELQDLGCLACFMVSLLILHWEFQEHQQGADFCMCRYQGCLLALLIKCNFVNLQAFASCNNMFALW